MGTLRVEVGTGPLRAEHERLLRTALRRGANRPERAPDETVDTAGYDEATLADARRVWRRRMVNEHQSAAVFSQLLPQLIEAEATLDQKTAVLRMSMDELRHGGLCGGVVEALGGEPAVRMPLAPRPLPTHPGCTPLERVMRNALFVGCLSETVAVALTAEERERTSEPLVRRVIDQIVADESLHARFGWALVQEAAPELDGAARDRTNRWLRTAFAYFEAKEMAEIPFCPPPDDERLAQGLALGVCENLATRELVHQTLREVVIPGLEAVGFAAEDAWRDRRAA
ncbi:MAG TPA: ferritin-like domain-containing protein [Sandaracinaceae bacterium LLY-WYZ-13_1]|nr:ferritin-like domain-containing protein [Sandaracinaceae bacterium LLY-WYZ-13_1]